MNKASVTQPVKTSGFLPPAQVVLQRQCACGNHTAAGGECAECAKKKTGLQRKLTIGASNDPLELEADRVADQVMAMPLNSGVKHALPHIQRFSGQVSDGLNTAPPSVDQVLASSGRPLEPTLRQDMESRFGQDFSRVRVHTGGAAEQSAREVNAQAYTVGNDVVFGARRFASDSSEGRRLIAHELAHVVQQGDQFTYSTIQREVVIEPTSDATDPAHNMPSEDQRDIVRLLVQQLCPGFDVPASSPLHVEGSGNTCDNIQNGSNPVHTGCCCLCVLTASGANRWTIIISQNESPQTNEAAHTVTINPSDSPIESLHWTDNTGTGTGGERMINRPRVITFGHELCGHAALMEIGSHPSRVGNRRTSDVHDPTIKIERSIWGEQGLSADEQRGLAAGGVHRGESVYRLTLDSFPPNVSDISQLPPGEQTELAELKRFASDQEWHIEVHGHSDHSGSVTVKQDISDRRAKAVRNDLAGSSNGSKYTFVKVQGHSDSQSIAGASASQLRRADVILSLFRAGVPTPPVTASPVAHILPDTPARHSSNLSSSDLCIRHLASEAWR